MKRENWNESNIPDQSGKIFIVTGSTSGLGKETARVLSRKNATVIMAVRNINKAESVAKEILSLHFYFQQEFLLLQTQLCLYF